MTLSTPTSGAAPRLSDFDAAAREMLSDLDHVGIRHLAIDAKHVRHERETADYPTDPRSAVAALKARRYVPPSIEIDDGLVEIEYSLALAVTILGREEEVDAADARALAWLLQRAESILSHERAFEAETRERIRRAAV